MKKYCYAIAAVCFLWMTASCGLLNKSADSSLYNKRDREKVKIKKGLFSAKRASFGHYSTSPIEDDVNQRIISFATQQDPFHFTLSENDEARVSVQAVYTDKNSLEDKTLPASFHQADIKKIFYAWISGSTVNNLNNWELIVKNPSYEELAQNAMIGVLRSSSEEVEVHANSRSGNVQSYESLTYEFQLKGIPVAAVQVNGKRKYVWIRSILNEEIKNAVTGAMAALLLK